MVSFFVQPAVVPLITATSSSGHSHIDILKIDTEGLEFETLATVIKPYLESGEPLPFGQLLIEIHLWGKTFADFLSWWESLEAAGLRPFWGEVITSDRIPGLALILIFSLTWFIKITINRAPQIWLR